MDECQWNEHAGSYHEEILSPFHKDVHNPVRKALRKIKNKKEKTAAEFGCGLF
jgi:hypothetical protein